LRTLVSGRLIDVAPVAVPAYRSTTVALRSLARFVGVTVEDVVNYAARDELRKLFVRTDSGGLSGAAARAQIMRKRYAPEYPREPTPGVVALNRTLAKKHPQHPPQ
jgi:uncharacterized protein